MEDSHELVRQAKDMIQGGEDFEEVVALLKRRNVSKVWSAKILSDAAGVSLEEAKDIVHMSRAWADLREEHDRFHDEVEQAIREHEAQDEE
jgi:ribosomal protein L7/L12